jgi:hypothetical protein
MASVPKVKDGVVTDSGSFFEIPKQYEWKPKEDITIYELALCMPIIVYGAHGVDIEYMIGALPKNAQRYFEEM